MCKVGEMDIKVFGILESRIQRKKSMVMLINFIPEWDFLSNGDEMLDQNVRRDGYQSILNTRVKNSREKEE